MMTKNAAAVARKARNEAKYARQCRLHAVCDKLREVGYEGSDPEVLARFERDVWAGTLDTAQMLKAKAEAEAAREVDLVLAKASNKMLRYLAGRQNFRPPHEVLAIIRRFKTAA